MNKAELKQAILSENEAAFTVNGSDCLLYGWDQCDGYVLSLERDGELVWQSAPQSKNACIEEFFRHYQEL